MDLRRLIGEDGVLRKAIFSSEYTGDGAQDINALSSTTGAQWVIITNALTSGSGFDTVFSDNSIFYALGTETPATGETFKVITFIDWCDITELTADGASSTIDVTTLCDEVKAGRAGKSEITGSFTGFRSEGGTATQRALRNSVTNSFIPVVTDDGAGTYTVTNPSDTIFYLFGFINEATKNSLTTGDIEEVVILPLRFTQGSIISMAVDTGDAFTGSFTVDGSLKPVLYEKTIA